MADNRTPAGNRPPTHRMLSRTLVLLIVCGIAAFLVIIGKLWQLQIRDHDRYESAAIDQQVRETALDSGRGSIYDRNGMILAMSASVDTVFISPAEIVMYNEDPALIARGLSDILGVDYAKILDMTSDTKSWYKTVARKVEREQSDQVRAFKTENKLNGIKIEADSKRYYPYGSLASHVIGFVGYENTGLSGIELSLDSVLTGSAGRVVRAKNAYGTDMLYTKFEDYYDAKDGNSAVLTIDATIQHYVEKHLHQAAEDYMVQSGAAAICMNVKTGEILAMASLDDFDLNNYQEVSDRVKQEMEETADPVVRQSIHDQAQLDQWRNKAVEDMYEPGSTFKPITVAMALEEGVVSVDDSFYCGGVYAVPGDTDEGRHCWNRNGHGMQTLTECLQHSCNVAMMQIAQRVGARRFYDYVDAFGFNDTTGIELAGEASSLWWDESLFFQPDNQTQLAAASFGQTFNITPLQLVRAISATVNGGYLMQPYLIKEIRDAEGNTVSKAEPSVIRQVISEDTSATMRQMLEAVVGDPVEGTGKNAYVAGYRVGGKTGTSTNTVTEAQTGEKKYIVSFVGVAPMDDPQICILVLLRDPDPACGIYVSGGNMGAPTVGNMMADILPYLGVEPNYSAEEKANMDRGVPNLLGMEVDRAKELLSNQGLGYRVIGGGATVSAQLPAANMTVAANSEIVLFAGSPMSDDLEEVPDLTNLTYDIARQRLGYLALFINSETRNLSNPSAALVTHQSIEPGTKVEHGTVVRVTLSVTDASMNGRY